MGNPAARFADLERPPLLTRGDAAGELRLAGGWWRVRVLESTGSTSSDLAAELRAGGAGHGDVLVAEEQTAGRGRTGRAWVSPPRAGLLLSAVLGAEPSPWVPLLAGAAVAGELATVTGLAIGLKWPNDLLVGEAKVGGLLCEVVEAADGARFVVAGLGLNVTTRPDELPTSPPGSPATALAAAGARVTDRRILLLAALRGLASLGALGPPDYRARCASLGRMVEVHLPGGEVVRGTAEAVDDGGRLVIAGRAFGAGDVVHARMLSP